MPINFLRAVGTVLVFLVFGSPIGAVVFLGTTVLLSGAGWSSFALMAMLGVPFSYLFGLIPALIVGLIYAVAPVRFQRPWLAALLGGAIVLIGKLTILYADQFPLALEAIAGAVSALCCACLVRFMGIDARGAAAYAKYWRLAKEKGFV